MKRVPVIAAACVTLALTVAACGSSSSGGDSGAAKTARPKIVMLLNDQFDPYYLTLVQGAQAESKKLGADFSWQAPTTLDVATQTQLLQSVAATRPSGIIMSAIDADAMVAPMKQVQSQGVPIMTVDADVSDPSARLGTVKSDGNAIGKAAADTANTLLGGQGTVGYVGYTPGVQSVDQRLAGWKAGLGGYSGLKNAGEQYADAETTSNVTKASALITKTPDLKAIFASWTNAVIGTGQAVEQSGKKIDVIGVDAAPDEVSLLKRGVVTALVAQKPAEMGQIAVDDLVGYVKDGTKPPAEKLMDAVAITSDQATDPNYTKYFYVTPPKK